MSRAGALKPGLIFAACSLVAVAAGCWAASAHGVPVSVWGRNLLAWVVGAGLAALVARAPADRLGAPVALLGAGVLFLTLISPGLQGVHRWLVFGPVRFNAAQLVLPAVVVCWVADARRAGWRAWVLVPAAAVLALQPDASQAIGLAAAVVSAFAVRRPSRAELGAGAALVVACAVACLRLDPLAPVAEVEGIMRLAAEVSPLLALVAAAGVTGAVLAPALDGGFKPQAAGVALVGYLGATALAPIVLAVPVPWVGMGVSSILGAWLGLGLWLGVRRRA